MKNGVEIYHGKAGAQKGKARVHLYASGRIIATNGEGHMNLSQCQSWPLRVFKQLFKIGACQLWAYEEFERRQERMDNPKRRRD